VRSVSVALPANCRAQTLDLDIQQQFVVLADESGVRRIQPDRMEPLERLTHVFRPLEERREYVAPVIAFADDERIVREVCKTDERQVRCSRFLRLALLL